MKIDDYTREPVTPNKLNLNLKWIHPLQNNSGYTSSAAKQNWNNLYVPIYVITLFIGTVLMLGSCFIWCIGTV